MDNPGNSIPCKKRFASIKLAKRLPLPFQPKCWRERENPNAFFMKNRFGFSWYGGLYWTRTSDPIDVNDVLLATG